MVLAPGPIQVFSLQHAIKVPRVLCRLDNRSENALPRIMRARAPNHPAGGNGGWYTVATHGEAGGLMNWKKIKTRRSLTLGAGLDGMPD